MRPIKRYRVSTVSGEIVTEGTARECAEDLGITDDGFRTNAHNPAYKKFVIVELEDERENAIKSWDAFCEPIRKKYGIPVYRSNGGGKDA